MEPVASQIQATAPVPSPWTTPAGVSAEVAGGAAVGLIIVGGVSADTARKTLKGTKAKNLQDQMNKEEELKKTRLETMKLENDELSRDSRSPHSMEITKTREETAVKKKANEIQIAQAQAAAEQEVKEADALLVRLKFLDAPTHDPNDKREDSNASNGQSPGNGGLSK